MGVKNSESPAPPWALQSPPPQWQRQTVYGARDVSRAPGLFFILYLYYIYQSVEQQATTSPPPQYNGRVVSTIVYSNNMLYSSFSDL